MLKLKSRLSVIAVVLFVFCFAGGGPSYVYADTSSDYYSLHLEPTDITYKDSKGDYQFETRSGFRYVHDYADPKVLCGSEIGPCTQADRRTAVRVLNQNIRRFKVYVPPGSAYLQILLYLPKLAEIVTVSRFEQPPGGDYSSWHYSDFPVDTDKGANLDQLSAADYLTRNSGGHTTIISQHSPGVPEGGGWLYVKVTSFDASAPIEIRYTFNVRVPEFLDWFKTVDWDAFGETGGFVSNPQNYVADGDTSAAPPPQADSDEPVFGRGNGPKTGGGGTIDEENNPVRFLFDFLDAQRGDAEKPSFTKLVESVEYVQVNLAEITDDSGNLVTQNLRPRIKVGNRIEGPYQLYAALVAGEFAFMAERDMFGHIVFTRYVEGDRLSSYQTSPDSLAADDVLECEAFVEAFTAEEIKAFDRNLFSQSGLWLLFAVASESNLSEFQGTIFAYGEVSANELPQDSPQIADSPPAPVDSGQPDGNNTNGVKLF